MITNGLLNQYIHQIFVWVFRSGQWKSGKALSRHCPAEKQITDSLLSRYPDRISTAGRVGIKKIDRQADTSHHFFWKSGQNSDSGQNRYRKKPDSRQTSDRILGIKNETRAGHGQPCPPTSGWYHSIRFDRLIRLYPSDYLTLYFKSKKSRIKTENFPNFGVTFFDSK